MQSKGIPEVCFRWANHWIIVNVNAEDPPPKGILNPKSWLARKTYESREKADIWPPAEKRPWSLAPPTGYYRATLKPILLGFLWLLLKAAAAPLLSHSHCQRWLQVLRMLRCNQSAVVRFKSKLWSRKTQSESGIFKGCPCSVVNADQEGRRPKKVFIGLFTGSLGIHWFWHGSSSLKSTSGACKCSMDCWRGQSSGWSRT